MQKYEHNLTANTSGVLRPLSGASIVVTDGASGLPASIYSDNGTTPLQQPLVTNNDGYFGFYAADGKYTLTFTSPRFETFTREVVLDDPADDPYATLAQLSAPSGSSMVSHGEIPLSEILDEIEATLEELNSGEDYRLPIASTGSLGGVKVGANLTIDASGLLSAPGAGASAMVLIGAATITSPVALINFLTLFSAQYNKYVVEFEGLAASSSAGIRLRLATAGAANAGALYTSSMNPGNTTTSATQDGFNFGTAQVPISGTLEIRNANDPVNVKAIGCRNIYANGSGTYVSLIAEGLFVGTQVASGFQLFLSAAGNFTGGTVRVYGIKNT